MGNQSVLYWLAQAALYGELQGISAHLSVSMLSLSFPMTNSSTVSVSDCLVILKHPTKVDEGRGFIGS